MNLEEKLKAVLQKETDATAYLNDVWESKIITGILSICQEAVDEHNKKIVGLIDDMIKQLENVAFLSVSMDRREAIPNAKIEALIEPKEKL